MNIWILIASIASLVVVLMSVAILFGRADKLVYELRGDDCKRYNPTRLRAVTAIEYMLMMLLVWASHLFDFNAHISFLAILLLAVLTGIIKGTWATK